MMTKMLITMMMMMRTVDNVIRLDGVLRRKEYRLSIDVSGGEER
jgi:hypothetical protein